MKKRLGEILLERGLIDNQQLNAALAHQRQWGMRLGTALVAKGFVAEGMLTRVLSESLSIPMVDLARIVIDPRALQLVSRRVCELHDVMPLAIKDQPSGKRMLLLAMADPINVSVADEIAFTTDCIVKPAIAQISSLEQAIRRHYYGQRVDIAPLNFDVRHRSGDAFAADEPMTINASGGLGERVVHGRAASDLPEVLELKPEAEVPADAVTPLPMDYDGHRAGVFAMAPGAAEAGAQPPSHDSLPITDGDILAISRAADLEQIEALDKKFWALMRVLAKRGLVTKEEFLHELRQAEGDS